ncbi:DUF1801 domain-containing protein [Clostridium sp. KNHs205]|uniref:iron chaperone n=1 Tax=Clostridium sp. KNHs205 TaxID=1449050 RepID=UPI00051B4709|nr:DUF1801 domain-containing protein [Clostridium sp. KNHs205]
MEENKQDFTTIDEYIRLYPAEVQEKLTALRELIHSAAPEATEAISWRMPTFRLHGNLVHFAVFKKHIGFYPGESGIRVFEDRMKDYKSSKGAVQFPLDKPLPLNLVEEIVLYRVKENTELALSKKKNK